MKKIITVTIALSMIFSLASSIRVSADDAKMKDVLTSVKERIENTEEYEEFSSRTYDSDGKVSFSFSWTDNSDGYKSINVRVTESGIITSYSFYDEKKETENRDFPKIKTMSTEDVLQKAKELVKKLNPDIYDSLEISKISGNESLFDKTYSFNIQRYENNIPVMDNSGYVNVSADASYIINFNITYNEDVEFETKENIIDKATAWEKLEKESGVKLIYKTKTEDGKRTVYPVWIPLAQYDQYINAKTGKIEDKITNIRYTTDSFNQAMKEEAALGDSRVEFSKVELEEIEKVSDMLSKEEVESIIKGNKVLDTDEDMEMVSINSYGDRYGDERYYNVSFSNEGDKYSFYANALINTKTGEIISWNSSRYESDDNQKNTDKHNEDEIIEILKNSIKEISPKYFGNDSEYIFDDEHKADNSIHFKRYVNGIEYVDNYAYISVNPQNAKVNNFSINHYDVEFPALDSAITVEVAFDKLKSEKDIKLYYIPTVSDKEKTYYDKAVLGYSCGEVANTEIDAFSGNIIKNENEEENKISYSDISGHFAEYAINTLAKYGIGFEGEKFEPSKTITTEEFVVLLTATFKRNDAIILRANADYNSEIEMAKRYGILKESGKDLKTPLTRENAAIYLIRMMGFEEVAELQGIYNSPFSDVMQNIGHISILGAMGVFKGDENNNFNPYNNLTKAEAALVIYNYINR